VVSLSYPANSATGNLRPVNIRTDLAALADLIEIVFADSMDFNGRAAVNEMRMMSRMGFALSLLAGMNDMTLGLSMGYVWVVDGKIVGNVSIYPANYPHEFGSVWIIANVGTHPDYRGRGIANDLMQASMEMIHKRGGSYAILQVDAENSVARRLYERLGFAYERGWTTWRRSPSARIPATMHEVNAYITRRRPSEWETEYELAKRVRPFEQGGLGWQRPLHPRYFRPSLLRTINDWLSLRNVERLIIRDSAEQILAALWIDNTLTASSTQMTLFVHPDYQGRYDDALLNNALQRYSMTPLSLEHPADDTIITPILEHYRFTPKRTVMHMRWDAR
jgi:ribosomal protein S18 acetylase RimI-like enzyme